MTKYPVISPVDEYLIEKNGKWFHMRLYDAASLTGPVKTYEQAFIRLIESDLT